MRNSGIHKSFDFLCISGLVIESHLMIRIIDATLITKIQFELDQRST